MQQAGYDCKILSEADINSKKHDEENHKLEGTRWGVLLPGGGFAEHENNIKGILRALNIDPKGIGVQGRSMTSPVDLKSAEYKVARKYYLEKPKILESSVLFVGCGENAERAISSKKDALYYADRYNIKADLTAAWDEKDFKIAGWTDAGRKMVKRIIRAAKENDLTVYLTAASGFSYPGLIIAITSKMPRLVKDKINNGDKDRIKLQKAAEKTGIEKTICKAENLSRIYAKPYFSLTPKWANEEEKKKTKHPVIFYLNPVHQENYNSGYFTVEDLEKWTEGRGIILKK